MSGARALSLAALMRIPCPFCGERDAASSVIAAMRRDPSAADARAEAYAEYVYLRDNPAGAHKEWWQHALGLPRRLFDHARYTEP